MNPLKEAFSAEAGKEKTSSQNEGSLLKGVSRNKTAGGKWNMAIDDDDDELDSEPLKQDPYSRILNTKLQASFAYDPSAISPVPILIGSLPLLEWWRSFKTRPEAIRKSLRICPS